jgi:hypothetical protein
MATCYDKKIKSPIYPLRILVDIPYSVDRFIRKRTEDEKNDATKKESDGKYQYLPKMTLEGETSKVVYMTPYILLRKDLVTKNDKGEDLDKAAVWAQFFDKNKFINLVKKHMKKRDDDDAFDEGENTEQLADLKNDPNIKESELKQFGESNTRMLLDLLFAEDNPFVPYVQPFTIVRYEEMESVTLQQENPASIVGYKDPTEGRNNALYEDYIDYLNTFWEHKAEAVKSKSNSDPNYPIYPTIELFYKGVKKADQNELKLLSIEKPTGSDVYKSTDLKEAQKKIKGETPYFTQKRRDRQNQLSKLDNNGRSSNAIPDDIDDQASNFIKSEEEGPDFKHKRKNNNDNATSGSCIFLVKVRLELVKGKSIPADMKALLPCRNKKESILQSWNQLIGDMKQFYDKTGLDGKISEFNEKINEKINDLTNRIRRPPTGGRTKTKKRRRYNSRPFRVSRKGRARSSGMRRKSTKVRFNS